jgi:hypothetical protein
MSKPIKITLLDVLGVPFFLLVDPSLQGASGIWLNIIFAIPIFDVGCWKCDNTGMKVSNVNLYILKIDFQISLKKQLCRKLITFDAHVRHLDVP